MVLGPGGDPGVADPDAVVVVGRGGHVPIVPDTVPIAAARHAVPGLVFRDGLTWAAATGGRRPGNDRIWDDQKQLQSHTTSRCVTGTSGDAQSRRSGRPSKVSRSAQVWSRGGLSFREDCCCAMQAADSWMSALSCLTGRYHGSGERCAVDVFVGLADAPNFPERVTRHTTIRALSRNDMTGSRYVVACILTIPVVSKGDDNIGHSSWISEACCCWRITRRRNRGRY